MDVRIDQPGHQRELLQIVRDRAGRGIVAARYARDARSFNDQRDVVARSAFTIEQAASAKDDASLRKDNAWRCAKREREGGWTESAAQSSSRGRSAHERGPNGKTP